MISDGTLTTIWDRAGRILSYDGHSCAYDGEGRRIAQTAGGSTTRYVLDVQRRLPAVIGAKAGSDITHYMHGPLGMFAQRNPDASWDWMLHDGLGSVRGVFDGTLQSAAEYDPFGEPIVAPIGTAYGFTGELTDGNGLVYLRARYLAASLGTFASRDPWRGSASAPRTWNGYAWVEGNVVNRVDGSGMCWQNSNASPQQQNLCFAAWEEYSAIVSASYPQGWPREVQILMTEEAGFWSSLSYADFARTWNDNSTRPPSFTDPTAELAGDSIVVAGVVSMANPLPGPEDLIGAAILVGGLCLAAVALVAGATAIGLPARQSVNFDKLIGTAHTQPLSRTNATDTHDHILLIKRDLKQAKAAAIEAGVDPSCLNKFSDFLHDEKEVLKGSANERGDYTWDELIDLASEFLQIYPSCTKRGRSSRFVVPPVWDSSREETEFEDARSR